MTMTTEFNPQHLRTAFGSFATGVTIITARAANGELVGLTANSFASVSLRPPLVLWSIDLGTPSFEVFRDCSHYAINVLSADQEALSNRFAMPSDDKFAGLDYCNGAGGAPLLSGCIAHFECANEAQHAGGDHLIMVGRIENYSVSSGAPLLFFRSSYARIADSGQQGK